MYISKTCFSSLVLLLITLNIKIQLSVLVLYKADLIIISLKTNLFLPWLSWKIAELAFNNNHSLTQNIQNISLALIKPLPFSFRYSDRRTHIWSWFCNMMTNASVSFVMSYVIKHLLNIEISNGVRGAICNKYFLVLWKNLWSY